MDPRTALATSAAVVGTALLGGLASTGVRSTWYRRLDKPSFQPPGAVFGPVWTVLYADIAVTSAVALDGLRRDDPTEAAAYQRALAVNLVLNASWSWVFFRGHRLLPAVLVAGALATSSADLVRRTGRVDRRAGAALAPYAAWCTFATVLSTALWRRNR
ncbi:TspO/MBR family protein [Microlunatus capsulatus]|uniref:Tryptophan-rich sensory protein n=1 Tax=Microlunatus capsulatus TaxID=99117 RepID=A0ABS4Z4A4_9ACTN|nr:TspO/MBR family protein [Microlunatus capsulatus]MBP2415863.1 tryptophan-rich sensory protein [Microlunatus capsulatus]